MAEPVRVTYYIPNDDNTGYVPCYFENDAKNIIFDDSVTQLGADNAQNAINNLTRQNNGKAPRPVQKHATILAANWINGSNTVSVEGVTNKSLCIIGSAAGISVAQYEAFGAAGIIYVGEGTNTITLKAAVEVPTINLPIVVTIIEQESLTPTCILSLPGGSGGLRLQKVSTPGEFDKTTTAPTATNRLNYNGYLYATRIFGAAYNDYAEYRLAADEYEPGTVVSLNHQGLFEKSLGRYGTVNKVVTDNYGMIIGYKEGSDMPQIPIAVAGKVRVNTEEPAQRFSIGDSVCAAPDGKASLMSREELREYPDKILGIVSEINIDKNEVYIEVK